MKKFVLFLSLIFFAISCEPPDHHSGFGELEGYTYLKDKSNPLEGLGIRAAGNSLTYTDANGYFYFPEIPEGVQKLEVLSDMNPIYTTEVTIKSDRLNSYEITFNSIQKDLPDFTAVDIHNESDWDYWVVGKEEYFYIDAENDLPKFVFLHSFKNNKDYGITFNDEGLPSKVNTDHFLFLFDNFKENKVDLAIVSPDNNVQIFREVKTDFIWPSSSKSRADVIRWTGRILEAIPCVTFGVSALVTGGAAIPLALWTCGNYFLSMADNFLDDANVENGFTDFVTDYKLVKTHYECVVSPNITSCVISLATKGIESYADYIEEMDQRVDVIRIAEASLFTGYGDIQITLTWDNTSDLDLHVIDPLGEEIYWMNKRSTSGGILDYDDMDGYGPENVYWPETKAPNGDYQVYIHDYPWVDKPLSANFRVLLTIGDKITQFTGTISLDETVPIIEFNLTGTKSTNFSKGKQSINLEHKKQN